jgi:acetyltransferase-like isoleucine patch superfamily enzyme
MNVRASIKHAANFALRVATAPLVAAYRAQRAITPSSHADLVIQSWSQVLSLVPGLTGQFLRRAFYREAFLACHEHSCINWGTVFSSDQVHIDEGVYIGARCMLGRAHLEPHVTIGSNVDVLSGKKQHAFDDPTMPIQQQGGTYETVRIGANSWIGNGAVVMADIGRGAIVAAGSVVVHPVPDMAIVAGNPARVIRMREPAIPAQVRAFAPASL